MCAHSTEAHTDKHGAILHAAHPLDGTILIENLCETPCACAASCFCLRISYIAHLCLPFRLSLWNVIHVRWLVRSRSAHISEYSAIYAIYVVSCTFSGNKHFSANCRWRYLADTANEQIHHFQVATFALSSSGCRINGRRQQRIFQILISIRAQNTHTDAQRRSRNYSCEWRACRELER